MGDARLRPARTDDERIVEQLFSDGAAIMAMNRAGCLGLSLDRVNGLRHIARTKARVFVLFADDEGDT